ncbi:MAG: VWA domain-containing protein [Phycisphaeraceae bacterium]|nr:VWA domain-containing protein [Phycisphaeraceae bacterium]
MSASATLAIAAGVALLALLAEWLHARRVRRVARLAFGASGAPRPWARASPLIRVISLGVLVWGLLTLARLDPTAVEERPSEKTSQQILLVLDVSPSMQVKDAGPDLEKVSRAHWAGVLIRSILDRLDMRKTRISVVAFYTGALPILSETFDKQVVANMLDGLPMHLAFAPGGTDASAGLEMALEMARRWPRRSAMLVFVGDGDLERPPSFGGLPASIADVLVIGVGDTDRATTVGGHSSRQDGWTLKQLAARLGGRYHEGNRRHLPTALLDALRMTAPSERRPVTERTIALWASALGASSLACLGPLLILFGVPRAASAAEPRRALLLVTS